MNPRLLLMNTQASAVRLEAGQSFRSPSHTAGPAVLVEGELLLQEPARWLGETVLVSAPVRLVAPAVLPPGSTGHAVAVSASTVVVRQSASLLARASSAAASWWIRLRSGRSGARSRAPASSVLAG